MGPASLAFGPGPPGREVRRTEPRWKLQNGASLISVHARPPSVQGTENRASLISVRARQPPAQRTERSKLY
eukprot:10885559-Lingulodinium_polyedra.AAC.1